MKVEISEKFFPFTLEVRVETKEEAEILFCLSQHKDTIPHIVSRGMSGVTSGDVTILLDDIADVIISKLNAEKILTQELGKERDKINPE